MHEKASRERLLKDVAPLGKVFWWLGAMRLYRNGDWSVAPLWRWWHPLTWLFFPVAVVACGFMESRVQDAMPFRLPKHYRDGSYPLEWLK